MSGCGSRNVNDLKHFNCRSIFYQPLHCNHRHVRLRLVSRRRRPWEVSWGRTLASFCHRYLRPPHHFQISLLSSDRHLRCVCRSLLLLRLVCHLWLWWLRKIDGQPPSLVRWSCVLCNFKKHSRYNDGRYGLGLPFLVHLEFSTSRLEITKAKKTLLPRVCHAPWGCALV